MSQVSKDEVLGLRERLEMSGSESERNAALERELERERNKVGQPPLP